MIKYNKVLQIIAKCIASKEQINLLDAYKIVEKSFLSDILNTDPEYIQHYAAEYWTDLVLKEYKNNEEDIPKKKQIYA
jgi:hypothetical protein